MEKNEETKTQHIYTKNYDEIKSIRKTSYYHKLIELSTKFYEREIARSCMHLNYIDAMKEKDNYLNEEANILEIYRKRQQFHRYYLSNLKEYKKLNQEIKETEEICKRLEKKLINE